MRTTAGAGGGGGAGVGPAGPGGPSRPGGGHNNEACAQDAGLQRKEKRNHAPRNLLGGVDQGRDVDCRTPTLTREALNHGPPQTPKPKPWAHIFLKCAYQTQTPQRMHAPPCGLEVGRWLPLTLGGVRDLACIDRCSGADVTDDRLRPSQERSQGQGVRTPPGRCKSNLGMQHHPLSPTQEPQYPQTNPTLFGRRVEDDPRCARGPPGTRRKKEKLSFAWRGLPSIRDAGWLKDHAGIPALGTTGNGMQLSRRQAKT